MVKKASRERAGCRRSPLVERQAVEVVLDDERHAALDVEDCGGEQRRVAQHPQMLDLLPEVRQLALRERGRLEDLDRQRPVRRALLETAVDDRLRAFAQLGRELVARES